MSVGGGQLAGGQKFRHQLQVSSAESTIKCADDDCGGRGLAEITTK